MTGDIQNHRGGGSLRAIPSNALMDGRMCYEPDAQTSAAYPDGTAANRQKAARAMLRQRTARLRVRWRAARAGEHSPFLFIILFFTFNNACAPLPRRV